MAIIVTVILCQVIDIFCLRLNYSVPHTFDVPDLECGVLATRHNEPSRAGDADVDDLSIMFLKGTRQQINLYTLVYLDGNHKKLQVKIYEVRVNGLMPSSNKPLPEPKVTPYPLTESEKVNVVVCIIPADVLTKPVTTASAGIKLTRPARYIMHTTWQSLSCWTKSLPFQNPWQSGSYPVCRQPFYQSSSHELCCLGTDSAQKPYK